LNLAAHKRGRKDHLANGEVFVTLANHFDKRKEETMEQAHISFRRAYCCSLTVLISCMVLFMVVCAPSPAPGEVKSSVSVATDKIGAWQNTVGNAFAKVISQYSKTTAIVRPFSGADSWIPSLNKGDIELGIVSAAVIWYAYNAAGPPYSTPLTNLRLLRCIKAGSQLSFVVYADSGIRTIKDLKGRRVPAGLGTSPQTLKTMEAALKSEGLDWSDVTTVSFPDPISMTNGFGAGRVDTAWATVGQPAIREIDVKRSVRYLPMIDNAKTLEIVRRLTGPAFYIGLANKGAAPGILEDTPLITYDYYLVAAASLDDDTVTALLSTLWDHTDALLEMFAGTAPSGLSRDGAVATQPTVPYHDAAIRFYKAKGAWKKEAETLAK
jgi:uncharacterized protein